jgi:alpha-galactosidase
MQRYVRIDGGQTTFAIATEEAGAPRLVHFGTRLRDDADLAGIDAALRPGTRESMPDAPLPASLWPPAGLGWFGEPAISGIHEGGDGALSWTSSAAALDDQTIRVTLIDQRTGLRAVLSYVMDRATGVLASSAKLFNDALTTFRLRQAASLCLPLPSWATDGLMFEGDWSRELQPTRMNLPAGMWSRTNRSGRTGFAGSTFAALEAGAGDQTGRVLAIHLAWSGDHHLLFETLPGGQRIAMAGAELSPGEVDLEPGASFETPIAYTCFSNSGFNGVSDAFHPFVRDAILPVRARGVRKVHFNSWEAAYFEFDEASLRTLASAAAKIGVERFVLDDGWFAGRRNDTSSLGDWRVDRKRFAQGLAPLIEHVRELGMDFGIWVEPEMVSPDSDLYRQHPDWCVHAPGAERPTMRNQLWLDMAREDVRDHVFGQLDALLAENAIAYLKWDCNRFQFPATSQGIPASGRIIRGTYALLDRIRQAHPHVEIESCASGGARVDLEMLKRASRIWPSDTTDAIERIRIQRWASMILPLETIGAHVGSSPNPITGRELSMAFRSRIAMFGHLGVEMDPRKLSESDLGVLSAHIALYKQHRSLIHSGRHLRWTTDDGAEARLCISDSRDEALAMICRVGVAGHAESAPVRFPGLDPADHYRVTLLKPWPKIAGQRLRDPEAWLSGRTLHGHALAEIGLRLPLADPQTAWLLHFQMV